MHIWQLSLMDIMWLDCGREGAGNHGTWGQVERIKNSYPGEEIILGRLDIFQHIDGYYLGREICIYVIQNDRAVGGHARPLQRTEKFFLFRNVIT